MLRISLNGYGLPADVWEALAAGDPYFHLTTTVLDPRTGREKTVFTDGGWLDLALAAALRKLTGSTGAILRADYFLARAATTARGGFYYQLADVPATEAEFYKLLGLDIKTIGRLQSDAGANLIRSPRPPEPSWDVPADSLPLVLDLLSATLAVPSARIAALDTTFRALGATVTPEGEGIVVDLEGVRLRIRPEYRGAGVERLEFVLRRPAVGNPSYHFGSRSVLRFGPGRRATWTF